MLSQNLINITNNFIKKIKDTKRPVGELEEKTSLNEYKLYSFERKYESKKENTKVIGYIYEGRVVRFGKRK